MCAKSWRKTLNDFSVSPQVIAEMLQGEFAARSENEQAARVSQVLGCSPNTARALLGFWWHRVAMFWRAVSGFAWRAYVRADARLDALPREGGE